jgi:hypothetical protein
MSDEPPIRGVSSWRSRRLTGLHHRPVMSMTPAVKAIPPAPERVRPLRLFFQHEDLISALGDQRALASPPMPAPITTT